MSLETIESAPIAKEWDDLKFRVGIFYVDRELIKSSPESARALLKDMLIVRAELIFTRDAVEYVAYCPHFEPTNDQLQTPLYEATVYSLHGEPDRIEWRKQSR